MRHPLGRALRQCRLVLIAGAALTFCSLPGHAQDAGSGPQTVEFHDLAYGAQKPDAVSIGRLAFVGLVHASGQVHADRVDIERLTFRFGSRAIAIPALTVTAFDASEAFYRALTEPANASSDWGTLIRDVAAKQIAAARILDRDEAAGFQSTLTGLIIDGLRSGIAADARIEGMQGVIALPQAGAPPSRISTGEVRYSGLDIAEWVHFVVGGGSEETKRILESATVQRLTMTTGEAEFAIAEITITGIDARAPREAIPGDLSTLTEMLRPDADPVRRQQIFRYVGELLQGMRIGRYSLAGLTIKVPAGPPIVIGAVTFGGLDAKGLELLEIRGIDVHVPTGEVKVARFAIERINYAALLAFGLKTAMDGVAPDVTSASITAMVPRIAAIQIEGVSVDTADAGVAVDSLRIEGDDRPAALPERFAVLLRRLSVDLTKSVSGPPAEKLVSLGYRKLVADGQIHLRAIPEERAIMVEDTGVLADDIGRLEVALKIGNVDLAALAADPETAERLLAAGRFESAEMRVRNLGFAERAFADVAKKSGLSEEAVRAGFAALMQANVVQQLGGALTPGSAEAVAAFFRAPGTITMRATPRPGAPPLALGDLQGLDPAQIAQRLTIAIETAKE